MRALLLLFLALLATAPVAASGERVVTERYVAGVGDVACTFPSGLGCLRFFVEGGETSVRLVVEDDVMDGVAFDACSPGTCQGATGSFCAEGTLVGLHAGDQLVVFLREATALLACGVPRVGSAVSGTVTATFT